MAEEPRGAGVAVLGMHRSGTSAVAGFLVKAGFFAGQEADLLPPAEDNPKGFFEREDINQLNDALLDELGGAWDKPPPRRLVEERGPSFTPRARDALSVLAAGAEGRPVLLKDPRISLLLPTWLPVLDEHSLAVVLVDRSPLDVALSVRRRDHRPLYVALALWQLYCAELLNGLAGRRVLVVPYERFVADPEGQGALLLDQLSAVAPTAGLRPADAQGFVSAGMRHERSGDAGAHALEVLTVAQAELHQWLRSLGQGWVELAAPERLRAQPESALVATAEYFDMMADRYGMETAYDTERHRALHFEQATELKDRHIENIEAALAKLQSELEKQSSRAQALEERCQELAAAGDGLRAQLERLHRDSRAAASNFLSAARRGWPGHQAG